MTFDNQTLGELFSKIEKEFLQDPDVIVIPVKGDPPSEYEITFHIPCTIQDEQGNISIEKGHTIHMSIPFGFPHFPPSCKPKGPIFHPDFDRAAICLGDFWKNSPDVAELIRHLKAMIGGEVYSVDNAFNTAAAEWFSENQSRLPFSRFDTSTHAGDNSGDDSVPSAQNEGISVVTDSDFADDFSFDEIELELESREATPGTSAPDSEPGPPEEEFTPTEFDIERFNLLASKRHFQELDAELSALPDEAKSPEIANLSAMATAAMEKAATLNKQALQLQHQGQLSKALQCFQSVEQHVADFPDILDKISRLEKQLEDEPAVPNRQEPQPEQVLPQSDPASKTGSTISAGKESDRSTPQADTVPAAQDKKTSNLKANRPAIGKPLLIAVAGLTILAAGAGSYLFFNDKGKLQEGRSLLLQCTTALQAQQFPQARQACLDAQSATGNIYVLYQADVSVLEQQIHSTLNSQTLRQGLKGNVLFNGKYIPKETVAQHKDMLEAISAGQSSFDNAGWLEAAAHLEKALELNSRLSALEENELSNIREQFTYASFVSRLEGVENTLTQGEDQVDIAILTSLNQDLAALSTTAREELRPRLEVILARHQFSSLKQQADLLFAKSDWPGAMSLFAKAAETGKLLSKSEPPELSNIRKNITRAELYSTIEKGNSFFAEGQWNEAIGNYQQAISILRGNYQLLDRQNQKRSIEKLERVILQSSIIRDRQSAEMLKKDGDLDEAALKLEQVITTISASSHAREQEFVTILEETRESAEDMKQQAFIRDCISYLEENYYSLVTRNYAAATRETLTAPSAEFIEQLDTNNYLFKLQCTETGRGRPLKLILHYTYNRDQDRWDFYRRNESH